MTQGKSNQQSALSNQSRRNSHSRGRLRSKKKKPRAQSQELKAKSPKSQKPHPFSFDRKNRIVSRCVLLQNCVDQKKGAAMQTVRIVAIPSEIAESVRATRV